jgi:hypothetical protein
MLNPFPAPVANAPFFDTPRRLAARRHGLSIVARPRLALVARESGPVCPSPQDRDLLWRAVLDRLTRVAGDRLAVQDCVSALTQLHAWQRNAPRGPFGLVQPPEPS